MLAYEARACQMLPLASVHRQAQITQKATAASIRVEPVLQSQCPLVCSCVCSQLRSQVEDVSKERFADQQQAQRQIEVGSRQLAAAQQQLQLKADIIHQLTGGLQVLAVIIDTIIPVFLYCLTLCVPSLTN